MLEQFFSYSSAVSQQRTLMEFSGLAEWDDNRDCLGLDFWFLSNGKLQMCQSLAQHGQVELKDNERPSSAHIDGAVEYLTGLRSRCDKGGIDPDTDARGWLDLPSGAVDPWVHDDAVIFRGAIKAASIKEFIGGCFYLPKTFAHLKPKLQSHARQKMGEPEIQCYLSAKADEMARFWAEKVGTLGASDNAIADLLHAAIAKPTDSNDAARLYQSMRDDIIVNFSRGRVPFYETDYSCGRALSALLRDANLSYLEKAMPWKTWRHFDFSDAPPLV